MGTINKKLKDISPIAVEAEAGNAGRVVYDLKTGVLKLEKELVPLMSFARKIYQISAISLCLNLSRVMVKWS